MPNGRNGGKRRSGRQERNKNERGGRTVKTAAPALFAFMGSASSSGGLSALRRASVPPRFGSRCFRIGQRKPIIRTHLLSEKGSDYMGLVREAGVELERKNIFIFSHYVKFFLPKIRKKESFMTPCTISFSLMPSW